MSKNNAVAELKPENVAASKIDAVKKLLFGEEMDTYNSEFHALKKEIEAKKSELEDLIERTQKEISELIDNVSTDLNIRITELEGSLSDRADKLTKDKVNRDQLGKLLVEIGEKIRA